MKNIKMIHHLRRIERRIFPPKRLFENIPNLQNHTIYRNCLSKKGPIVCWKCGSEWNQQSGLFCAKCQVLQNPIQKDNYFKLLGIEEKFEIDQSFLKKKFRKLQTLVHPDKFENKTHEEQTISEEYSSLVNKAFSSLQLPLKRAEHLLALKGLIISEKESVDDPEFLMEIMTFNEEIDEADIDQEKLKLLKEKNRMMIEKLSEEISNNFRNNDIEGVKKCIVKLKYFTSINTRLNSIFREIGIID